MKASTRRNLAFALGLSAVVAMSGFLLNAAPPQAVGTWEVLGTTDPSSARTGAATATLDGTTLIAGGRMEDGTITDSILIYDPLDYRPWWGQLTAPRVNAAAARLEDGRVLVVGWRDRRTCSGRRGNPRSQHRERRRPWWRTWRHRARGTPRPGWATARC